MHGDNPDDCSDASDQAVVDRITLRLIAQTLSHTR